MTTCNYCTQIDSTKLCRWASLNWIMTQGKTQSHFRLLNCRKLYTTQNSFTIIFQTDYSPATTCNCIMHHILTDRLFADTTDFFGYTAVPNPTTEERTARATVSVNWRRNHGTENVIRMMWLATNNFRLFRNRGWWPVTRTLLARCSKFNITCARII